MSDLISKKATIEFVSRIIWQEGETWNDVQDRIVDGVSRFPSADRPEPGHWKIETETDKYGLKRPKLVCSKCEKEPASWDLTELFEFCPNCGAKMEGMK